MLIRSRTFRDVVGHPMEYSGLPAAAQSGSHAGAAHAARSDHILDCGDNELKRKLEDRLNIMVGLVASYSFRADTKWQGSWPRIWI